MNEDMMSLANLLSNMMNGRNNADGNFGFGGGGFIWFIAMFFLMMMMGGGNWGGNWGNRGGCVGNCGDFATKTDVYNASTDNRILDNQALQMQTMNGLGLAISQQGANQSQQILESNCDIKQLVQGTNYETLKGIMDTNRNIDNARFETQRSTCDILNATAMQTQQLLAQENANHNNLVTLLLNQENQRTRDQLLATQNALSNAILGQNIVNAVRPFPQPCYVTCSPYQSASNVGCGCGNA